MSWGVVATVAPELSATLRTLGARPLAGGGASLYAAGPFVFAFGGVGPARAARCAAGLLERVRPGTLVSTGFAGALAGDLETGAIVLGGATRFPASAEALRRARAADPRARIGPIVAADQVLLGAEEKRRVAERSGAVAVDLESEAIGLLARGQGIAFLCVKVILDTPDAPLASRYESLPRVLGEVVRRPATLTGILADARRARVAGGRLAEFYRALAATFGS